MTNVLWRSSLFQSVSLHLAVLLPLAVIIWGLGEKNPQLKDRRSQPVPVVIKEVPPVATPIEAVDVRSVKKNRVPEASKVRKIFGLRKNSLTTDDGAAVAIKTGNTLATAVDQTKMKPGEESLPTPIDEYLVTSMPKPVKEFRIPYPPEARAQNIEGVVVMDILVDEKGDVREVLLVDGPGYGLNEAAVSALKQFKFTPAFIDQQPVAVRLRYGYRFVLN